MQKEKAWLTEANVRTAELPEGSRELVNWGADVRGFGLRLRRGGKFYIVMYQLPGARRGTASKRMKIGTPETIGSVKEARNLARAALGKFAPGNDPIGARREGKRKDTVSVAAMLARYDAHLKRRQNVTRPVVLSFLRLRLIGVRCREISDLKGWELAKIIERHCQVVCVCGCQLRSCTQIPSSMPPLKGFRFPREIIAYAVCAHHRFALSTADVKDHLAKRSAFWFRHAEMRRTPSAFWQG
jgi:hypothetical protein